MLDIEVCNTAAIINTEFEVMVLFMISAPCGGQMYHFGGIYCHNFEGDQIVSS
jgi:hypothetical protein